MNPCRYDDYYRRISCDLLRDPREKQWEAFPLREPHGSLLLGVLSKISPDFSQATHPENQRLAE
jgi:hypothetical protein